MLETDVANAGEARTMRPPRGETFEKGEALE